MTAIATLPVLLQTGTHAARPAASAVGSGALYNCTTHGLIYQQLAGSWGTWLTLPAVGMTDPMTTRGDIIIRNSSNVTARLAHGSADTYLGSDGTDVAYSAVTDAKLSTSDITTNNSSTSKHGFLKKLSNSATDYMDGSGNWSVPAGSGGGGSVALLEQHTASNSATLDFTTFISSSYDTYLFDFVGIVPQTNAVHMYMRMGTGGGPTYDSGTNYEFNNLFMSSGGSTATGSTGSTAIVLDHNGLGINNGTAAYPLHGQLRLWLPSSTTFYKLVEGTFRYKETTASVIVNVLTGGTYDSTTAVTAVRFLMSSGNITSGTIRVYGYSNT